MAKRVNHRTVAAGITKVRQKKVITATNSKETVGTVHVGTMAEAETITGMTENICQENGKEAETTLLR